MKLSLPLKVIVFCCLCLLSIVSNLTIDRYHKVGEQLLQNNDFAKGTEHWQVTSPKDGMVTVEQEALRIRSTDGEASPRISQNLPVAMLGKVVVLKALVKTKDISEGENSWNAGRILLVQYLDGKPQYHPHHSLAKFEKTPDWKEYTSAFQILPGVSDAVVSISLNRVTGELSCKDLRLFQVSNNPLYSAVKWTLMTGWFLFAIGLFASILADRRRIGWLKPLLTVAVVAGLLVGITIPGNFKNDLKTGIVGEVKSYSAALSVPVIPTIKGMVRKVGLTNSVVDITKWAHFGLFALLTFFLLWQSVQPKPMLLLFDMLMLASGTEMAQLFVEGRGALISDVVVDMAGCVAGLVVWLVFQNSRTRISS